VEWFKVKALSSSPSTAKAKNKTKKTPGYDDARPRQKDQKFEVSLNYQLRLHLKFNDSLSQIARPCLKN
jgi:hypothetical protein